MERELQIKIILLCRCLFNSVLPFVELSQKIIQVKTMHFDVKRLCSYRIDNQLTT